MSDQTLLSERELEVLRLVAAGSSNNEIAQELIISPNTVKVHIRNIYTKLGVLSRTEASMEALRRGMISMPGIANDFSLPLEGGPDLLAAPVPADHRADPAELGVAADSIPASADDRPTPGAIAPPTPDAAAAALELAPIVESAAAVAETAALPGKPELTVERPSITHIAIPRHIALLIASLLVVIVIAVAAIGWIVANSASPTAIPSAIPTSLPRVENIWKSLIALPQPLQDTAGVYFDQAIYVVGGTGPAGISASTRRFDLGLGQWQTRASKPTPVASASGAVIGGQLYIPGGLDVNGAPVTTLDIYNIADDRWSAGPNMPQPRADYALAQLEGKLYVFGGHDGTGPVSTTLIYDPGAGQWSSGVPLPLPLSDAAIAQDQAGGEVFVIGGTTSNNVASLATLHYVGQTWTRMMDLPAPRVDAAATFITDRLYLIGGTDTARPILVFQGNFWSDSNFTTGYPLSRQLVVSKQRTIYSLGGRNATTTLAEVRSWTPTVDIYIPGMQR